MSLALAAQHLAAKGRHGDSTLVHMTPGEVAGLQALARAHGKKLTINPETGLPEAFSLKSLLPIIGGAALSMVPGVGPLMAAGIMGGGTALATGSLQKGLMAGLGAYGGAGIGGALANAGASAANTAASNALLEANPGLINGGGSGFGVEGMVVPQSVADTAKMSMTDKLTAGFKGLGTEAGRSAVMEQMGGLKGLAKYGGAALSPFLMAQSEQAEQRPTEYPHRFEFNAGATGAVQRPGAGDVAYFNPRLRQYAEGGSTGMTGQSDEYYRYLMGLAPAPRPYTPAPVAAPAATEVSTAPLAVTNPMAARRDDTYSDSMAFDDPNNPQNPNAWGNLTPLQQATFYANNPGYSAVSKGLSNFFGGTTLGKAQAALDPKGTLERSLVVQGLNPATGLPPGLNLNTLPASIQEGMLSGLDTVPTITDEQAAQMVADEINASLSMAPATPSVTQADLDDTASGIAADVNAANEAGIAAGIDPGEFARGGLSSLAAFANGGYNLGDYSDGGRLLRGPGDGVSDSIPASIANKRPARLADGEFVVPARIVSELGNGSTEAGARQLYAMMDRIQRARKKSVGKGKVAVNSRASKLLPA